MPDKDYYGILGVNKSASSADIKKAFRQLAQKYHPDKSGGDTEKFKEVNEAYQILSNQEKRQMYDQYGSAFEQAQAQGGAGGFDNFGDWASYAEAMRGSGQRVDSENINFGNLGDLFGDLFSFGGGARTSRTHQGQTIKIELVIDFREAVFGVVKEIFLERYIKCDQCQGQGNEPGSKLITCNRCRGSGQVVQTQSTFFGTFKTASVCSECHGQGQIPEKKCRQCQSHGRIRKRAGVKINIPAGINHGQTINVAGQGQAGEKGIPSGDLYVTISIRPDSEFNRQGNDIFYEQEISISQAVLGDKVDIKTIDGEVKLKIPTGTLSGQEFILRGKGVPYLSSSRRGDQIVKIKIKIPKKLTRSQKDLFKKLAENDL